MEPRQVTYSEVQEAIRSIDIDADPIEVAYHLRKFNELLQPHIASDTAISALVTHLNVSALDDEKFAIKMAAVFASHQFDHLVQMRNAMLTVLQQNFQAIATLKKANVQRFYNSIVLLGEYYNRKRFPSGDRIRILGKSLIMLLASELDAEIAKCCAVGSHQHTIDPAFAMLILSQVTLNGADAKKEHRQEVTDLMFSIRKCLIEVASLCSHTKAYLLMTLDLDSCNLGTELLDKLYGKFLLKSEESNEEQGRPADPTGSPSSSGDGGGSSSGGASNVSPKEDPSATKQSPNAKPSSNAKPSPNVSPAKTKTEQRTPTSRKATSNKENKTRTSPTKTSPGKRETQQQHQQHKTSPIKRSPNAKREPDVVPKITITAATPPPAKTPTKQTNGGRTQRQSTVPTTRSPTKKPTEPAANVLKQNGNTTAKSGSPQKSTVVVVPVVGKKSPTPAVATVGNGGPANGNSTVKAYLREENVENLTWEALMLEDDSPQKLNPHSKSFLSFLASK